jgi:multidrug efflux system membrane fusion protein
MNKRLRFAAVGLGLALMAASSGCVRKQPQIAPPAVPVVPVSKPVARKVTEYVSFTGRADAVNAVDIRARVTGYVVEMGFREGADVKAGQKLFVIDPRPYQAQYDQAAGQLNLYKAQLELAKANHARDKVAAATAPGAVSLQQLDQDKAAVDEAEASVRASEASLKLYQLNVDYTQVTSPVDGQVSRFYLTLGNLVNQDQTVLTSVVSLDPIYAYCEVDEPTVLRVRRAINEGKMPRYTEADVPIELGLQGEEGFPHAGKLDFVNNQVNPNTGTISVRGIFANPRPPKGARLISPGMYVRIRLRMGEPRPALLVVDRAITSDQGLKYVYVVDAKNKATYRRITTGWLEDDGLRVITAGLKPDDLVVVSGLQQVRPNAEVKPALQPMLFSAPADEGAAVEAPPRAATPAEKPAAKPAAKPAEKPAEKPTGSSRE